MWIRSQDKKTLVNVEEIRIMNKDITIFCGSAILGTYSTEEKALKVLDKIEDMIRYECCGVFQMPSEEDV